MTTDTTLRDWAPIRVYWRGSQACVDWCYMGDERFTLPFFVDTIHRRMRLPFNQAFRRQMPIEDLEDISANGNVIPPTGFIFHMSRCGSTLVAQMLAALRSSVVISEAPPIELVIRMASEAPPGTATHWLKWLVGALGQSRHDTERNYFIKFDSWNTLDLSVLRDAFPDVPWIFLYRDPIEVIVSQMKQRGSQMVPGTVGRTLPGVSLLDAIRIPPEEYCARVLAGFCSTAIDHANDERALLINYTQLPSAVTGEIARHFGVSFSPDDIEVMDRATQFNSKTPQLTFEPDTARKRSDATDEIRSAAERWLGPLYDRLEEMRRSQN